MTNTAGRKDWGYCQLAIKKIESQSLEWNQGINENISPAQYGNGLDPNDKTNLYQIFDNIKVNAAGHLVRENGYEKLNYPNPNTYPNNIADYISYAGEGQFPPQNTQTWQLTGEPYGLGTEILFNGELYKRVGSGNTPPTQPDCPVGRLWSNLGSLPSWPTGLNEYTYFQGQDIIFNGGVYQLLIPKIIISYNSTTPDQPNQITVWKCVGNYYGWNVSSIYAVGAYVNYGDNVYQCLISTNPAYVPDGNYSTFPVWQDMGAFTNPTNNIAFHFRQNNTYNSIQKMGNLHANPLIGINGVYQDLIIDWNSPIASKFNFAESFQQFNVVPTFNHLFLLSATTTGQPHAILKFDYQTQDSTAYPNNPWTLSPVWFDLSNENLQISPLQQSNVNYPTSLDAGTYSYCFSLVDDTGAESQLSNIITGASISGSPSGGNSWTNIITGIQNTIANSSIFYNTSIKSVNIYRTHSSGAADGYGTFNAPFYFVDSVPFTQNGIKNFFSPEGSQPFYTDYTPDAQLIEMYNNTGTLQASGNIGIYANLRLHIAGDPKYPHLLYISDPDTDNFSANNALIIPQASTANPISAIANIQNALYVFNKYFGICRLLPNMYGATAPYTIYPISTTYGCDRFDSCINAGGIIYFIFNNHLYSFNGIDVQDVGIPIQPTLDAGSYIKLSYNAEKEYMYINVKDVNFHSLRVYCWSTRHKSFASESFDYFVLGDQLAQIDDIYFNKQGKVNVICGYYPGDSINPTNNQLLIETPFEYIIPAMLSNNNSIARQWIIRKVIVPPERGKLNKLTLHGLNPMVFNSAGNYIGSGMQISTGTDDVPASNLMDASMPVARGVDVPLNLGGEDFYIDFIGNTPTAAMVSLNIAGQEAELHFWTWMFTGRGRINKGVKAGANIGGIR